MLATYFRAQACNNAWANHRLLTACGSLGARELAARRTGFFPNIIRTLNHILTVDWFYVGGVENGSVDRAAFAEDVPCPVFADLDREQRAVDRRLIAVCDDLDQSALAETVDLIRGTWTQTEPRGRILLHLFQHQIHHRGQVHNMLSGTSIAPPQLDEFFLGHEREQLLRQHDFAALGLDEATIWR